MKKYIITIAAALVGLTSCSEKFFDRYPTDQMTMENYMNDMDETESVLFSAYGAMRGSFANSIVYIGDLPTDNAYDYKLNNSSAHIQLHESTVDSKNTVISDLWYACYQIINRCNLVLENVEAKKLTGERANQMVGQAKFLRAYTYYVMVRVWGDVPLVKEDIKDYMKVFEYGRTPKADVYSFIIEELRSAASMLPEFWSDAQKGRITSVAANAMLGDVYLTLGQHSAAKPYFEAVIAKEGANLGLLSDYASIFDANNANNKEVIFCVQYAHNQTPSMSNYLGNAALGNIQGQYIDPQKNGESKIYGVNILMMTHELEAKFAEKDKRRDVVYTGVGSPDYGCAIPMTLKYFDYQNVADGKSGNPDSGCKTIISRYSDVLLKYAECLAAEGKLAEAVAQVKRVRDRAGLATEIALDKDSVENAIAAERQLELCMEGHRWFDLVRTGKALSTMKVFYSRANAPKLHATILQYEYGDNTSIEEYELLYPLPYAQVELNKSKLPQNPKY